VCEEAGVAAIDTKRHAGRVALITGAASALAALRFCVSRRRGPPSLAATSASRAWTRRAPSATALDRRCDAVCSDLRKVEQIELIVRRVLETHGRLAWGNES